MSKRLTDTDDEALEEEAKRILGATSYKEKVNAELHEIVAARARRLEAARFLSAERLDIEVPETRAEAWR